MIFDNNNKNKKLNINSIKRWYNNWKEKERGPTRERVITKTTTAIKRIKNRYFGLKEMNRHHKTSRLNYKNNIFFLKKPQL